MITVHIKDLIDIDIINTLILWTRITAQACAHFEVRGSDINSHGNRFLQSPVAPVLILSHVENEVRALCSVLFIPREKNTERYWTSF